MKKYTKKIDEYEIAEGIEKDGYEHIYQGVYMTVDVTAKLHVTEETEILELIRAGFYLSNSDGGEVDCGDFEEKEEVFKYISEQDLINLIEDKGAVE